MEDVAAWDGPCEFQLAHWSTEEPVAGLPVEYASIDIPDGCGLQAYEYDVQLQQHLVEYYSEASQQNIATSEKAKISNDDLDASSVVKEVLGQFKDHMNMVKQKMHKYPPCLGAVDKSYTLPRIVAFGPYHHGLEHLKQAEEVKHVAACHCTREGKFLAEMYDEEFIRVADYARRFYDKDVMAGIGDDDFRHMMFFDACFLVQFMLMRGSSHRYKIDESLQAFLSPNRYDIFHDVMLLENQLPWMVVEEVMRFMPVSSISKNFIYDSKWCMLPIDHRELPEPKPFVWYDEYKPPHLLGLLRYYIVGRSDFEYPESKPKNMSLSVSAMDLAEIGITLKANKTMQLIDMHLNQKGPVFTELCLAPWLLSCAR